MIDNIKITPLKIIPNEKGKVMHLLRKDSPAFSQFGEVYFSTIYHNSIKGWHLHKEATLNYVCIKGEVKLNAIKIISTDVNRGTPLIEISATPYSNDVIGLQDLYLQIDMNNVEVSMVDDRISSGNDQSGSNYLVKSSYEHKLVRGNPIYTSSSTY